MRLCYTCGKKKVEELTGTFYWEPPPNIPGGTMVIPNSTWYECHHCGQQYVAHDLGKALDDEAQKRNPKWRKGR